MRLTRDETREVQRLRVLGWADDRIAVELGLPLEAVHLPRRIKAVSVQTHRTPWAKPRRVGVERGECRPVVGFPGFEVSDQGVVWEQVEGQWLEVVPCPAKGGKTLIRLRRPDGTHVQVLLGRVVLEAFRGVQTDHRVRCWQLNRDGRDCRLSNLAWMTLGEAKAHFRGRWPS